MLEKYQIKIVHQLESECRKEIISFIDEKEGARFLDCGCGDGELTKSAAQKLKTKNMSGIEIFDKNIYHAQKNGIRVYKLDLNDRMPFEDCSFDFILASHIIEHLADTDVFLEEIYRILDVNGIFILATPNLAALIHIIYLIAGKQPTIAEVSDKYLVGTWSYRGNNIDRKGPAHRRIFTTSAISELLIMNKFNITNIKLSGYLPFAFPLAKIISYIDKKHAYNIIIKAIKST